MANVWGTEADMGLSASVIEVLDTGWDEEEATEVIDRGEYVRRLQREEERAPTTMRCPPMTSYELVRGMR